MAALPRPGSGNGDGVEAHQSAERLLAQRHNGLLPMGPPSMPRPRELEPMGSIFDLRLRPSERIQWALADNTALNEALQEAADPELYAAAGESAAAFGTELQRHEVWEGLEEPDSLDQGLADFLAQLDASWPA